MYYYLIAKNKIITGWFKVDGVLVWLFWSGQCLGPLFLSQLQETLRPFEIKILNQDSIGNLFWLEKWNWRLGAGAIIRQWWSQFPRSFCPTVLHRAGLLLELKRTTLFGGSRKIINCPPIRLLFSFSKLDALRIDVNRCKLLTKLKLTMKSCKVWELWSTMNNFRFSPKFYSRDLFITNEKKIQPKT